jgi:hypothetical protein
VAQNKGFSLGGLGSPCCCAGGPPFSEKACGCTVTSSTLTLTIVYSGSSGFCFFFVPGTTTVTLTYGTPPSYTGVPDGWFGTFTGSSGGTILCLLYSNTLGSTCNLFFYNDAAQSEMCSQINPTTATCSPLNLQWTATSGAPDTCIGSVGAPDCAPPNLTFTITP